MSTANVTQTGGAATVAVTVSRGLKGDTGATGAPGTTDYNELDNVPSEFPPEAHTHPVSDITPISSGKLVGRHGGGSGAGQEIGLDGGLEFHGANIRREALTGDVTAEAGSNSTTIANDAVTNAKLANVPTATIKGRITAGTGDPEDLTPAQAIEVIGAATPASVEAQIGGYPVSILENPQSLARFHDRLQNLDLKNNGYHVALTGFGDSKCSLAYEFGYVFDDLCEIYGLGGVCSFGFGNAWNGAPQWQFTGGAAQASADYTYDPGSNLITIPSAATATWQFPGTRALVKRPSNRATEGKLDLDKKYLTLRDGIAKVVVYYIKQSGAGTLNAKITQSGYADVTDSVSSDAADGCGAITLIPNNRAGAWDLVLEADTATVRVFGAIAYTDKGIIWLSSAVGGSTMTQQAACLTSGEFKPAYSELLTLLNCGLVLHNQRVPGDANWEANYETFFDAYETLSLPQIVLSEAPLVTENSPTTSESRDFLRPLCRTKGIGFFDTSKIITPALLTELGWNTGDVAHNLNDCNRYIASRFLDSVARFRMAFGAFGGEGLSTYQLAAERMRLLAFHEMRTSRIFGRNGITIDGAATSVYAAPLISSERGFRFLSTAALGHAAGRIGQLLCGSNTVAMNNSPLAFSGNGYRNVNLKSGLQAFLAFGGSSTTITTLTGITQKCFGLHFAWGPDVGSPYGATSEVVRIFSCDGTTVIYSGWVRLAEGGESIASTGGFGFLYRWNPVTKTHFLYTGQNRSIEPLAPFLKMSLHDPSVQANTAGTWCHAGIYAEDGDNIPSAAGEISFLNVTSHWGFLPTPYFNQ